MSAYFSLEQLQETVDVICSQTQHRPTVGMILGTGLGSLAEAVQDDALRALCERRPIGSADQHLDSTDLPAELLARLGEAAYSL